MSAVPFLLATRAQNPGLLCCRLCFVEANWFEGWNPLDFHEMSLSGVSKIK